MLHVSALFEPSSGINFLKCMPDDGSKRAETCSILCINTNTIIINIIIVLTGSKLCFTINRLLNRWFVEERETENYFFAKECNNTKLYAI